MRPVETIRGMRERGKMRMMEGVNSTMVYCRRFCKCHSVPQYINQQINQSIKIRSRTTICFNNTNPRDMPKEM
jgi:hypothetical protein